MNKMRRRGPVVRCEVEFGSAPPAGRRGAGFVPDRRSTVPNFDITVVIPVYNAEEYLGDTLASVEAQTLGMDRIQVVLVDDGSTDGSADICCAFADKHPGHVVFVQQENAGVSRARNVGLDHALGRIVTCLDSDDAWTADSFAHAVAFFDEGGHGVDVLCGKLELFEGQSSDHPLDYRFTRSDDKDALVYLGMQPADIQSTIGNCFFLRKAIGNTRFDEDLATSEDTLFVAKVLLGKCCYGVTPLCRYRYRKRSDGSSLSQVITFKKHRQNLEVCRRLFAASREAYGEILPFIQATALYIVNWQIFGATAEPLTEEERALWRAEVEELLVDISLDVLAKPSWLAREKKLVLYRMKYGEDVFSRMAWVEKDRGLLEGVRATSLNAKAPCYIYDLEQRGDVLHLEGTTDLTVFREPFQLFVLDEKSGRRFDAQLFDYPTATHETIAGEVVFEGLRFTVDVPLKPGCAFSFCTQIGEGGRTLALTPHYGHFALFSQSMKHDYHRFGDVMVKHIGKQLRTYRATVRMAVVSELRRLKEVATYDKVDARTRRAYVGLRLRYHLHRLFFKKPIWIFGDKEWKAGDNAENVYRYAVRESGFHGAKMYFALEKSSVDYPAVAAYGNVVDPSTARYRLLFLLASVVVSSRSEESMVNPFGTNLPLVKDLLNYDFVYLTHGTLFGDLAFMLAKPAKDIRRFCVSTQMERQALLTSAYAYGEDEVVLTGMARYDAYGDAKPRKVVAFLPTWRAHLAGKIIPGTSTREYVPHFKDTDFWAFYNGLINDERLLEVMRRTGYTGEFYVHPAFEKQAGDFFGNELISVGAGSADYERVLSESALLVTDYSGVGFDFGYQRKPVVYSQYDSVFSGGHTYGEDSYFDYDADGFGPVARSLEETVDAIIAYLEADCAAEPLYRERADAMFGFSDYQSCKRIFDAVVAMRSSSRGSGEGA